MVTRTALAPRRKGKSVPRKSSPPRRKPKSVAQNPFPPRRNAISAARNAIPPWRNGVMEHVEPLSIRELRETQHFTGKFRARPWNKERGTPRRSGAFIAPYAVHVFTPWVSGAIFTKALFRAISRLWLIIIVVFRLTLRNRVSLPQDFRSKGLMARRRSYPQFRIPSVQMAVRKELAAPLPLASPRSRNSLCFRSVGTGS